MTETVRLMIWGRDFNIPVEYDCYIGETVTPEQDKAVKNFLSHPDWLAKAKNYVEVFCRDSVVKDSRNDKKDNIFSYIKPEYLFVKRDSKEPRVVMVCKYRYDPEHGLAIVFSYEGEIKVDSQDMIL